MESQPAGMGFKIGTTAIIWSFSTGMLAICIPLVSMTDSGVILPLAVICGATVSTVVVWLSSRQQPRSLAPEEENQRR